MDTILNFSFRWMMNEHLVRRVQNLYWGTLIPIKAIIGRARKAFRGIFENRRKSTGHVLDVFQKERQVSQYGGMLLRIMLRCILKI